MLPLEESECCVRRTSSEERLWKRLVSRVNVHSQSVNQRRHLPGPVRGFSVLLSRRHPGL